MPESTFDNGDRVLGYIKENPGCYLRQIKTQLGLSMGTTQYHLDYLVKSKKITSLRRGLRKLYFVNEISSGIKEYHIFSVLSQETSREILLYIIKNQNATQSDLIREIGITGASISWHIKRLVDFKLIYEAKSGKYKKYKLAADSETLLQIIKNFKPGIWDRWNDRLADVVLSLSEEIKGDYD